MTVSVDAMASCATSRWHVPGRGTLAWRDWGDELVVYVGHRADTHLLSASAATVLLGLIEGYDGVSFDDLSVRVFGAAASALTVEDGSSLLAVVQDFERLGLVARSEP